MILNIAEQKGEMSMTDSKLEKLEELTGQLARYVTRKHLEKDEEELPIKMTPTKGYILNILYKKGRKMVNDLAEEVGLTSGATTLALNRLEEEGWIVRTRDTQDRRVVWVDLSETGKKWMKKIWRRRQAFWEAILDCLTEEEKDQLIYLMEKIGSRLRNKNDMEKMD
jgi:DNA-binding MarR family transcriptional regulator